MQPSRVLTVSIDRPVETVYAFAANPENLPRWAFFESIARDGDRWLATTRGGTVSIRFVDDNPFGVLDHCVRVAPDVEIYVPSRVIRNGAGSEVMFTLFRLGEMTDESFEGDAQTVLRDLAKLKEVLEST